ncbi:MAG: polysaccharide biosynthesis/export family protein [Cytophagales bacterium]|nr:polysaccharide biosynthesis/export family protein [Cytophagales bacterium]
MSKLKYLVLLVVAVQLSSCKLFFPNYLFRDNGNLVYFELSDSLQNEAQTIMPGDVITFFLTTREGYQLVDAAATGGGMMNQQMGFRPSYIVRPEGTVEFPIVGDVSVLGMTRLELENLLEEKYSGVYNDPFILLEVTNRRAFVFTGLGGGRVISLPTENTTLIEVIALVGGIPQGAKSHKIRVIRGDMDAPSIKKVDFSTIDGLKDADFIIQPNDLIVIEPITRVAPAVLRELTPVLTLITTVLTFYLLIRR